MKTSIATRIWLMTAIGAFALIAVGLIGFLGTKKLQSAILTINNETIPSTTAIDDIKSQTFLTRVNALRHTLVIESSRKEAIDKEIAASRAFIDKRLQEYEKLVNDETDKKMFAEDRKLYAVYLEALEKLLDLSRQNDNAFARVTLDKDVDPAAEKLRAALEAHQKYTREQAAATGKASEVAATRSAGLSGITILLGVIAISLIGAVIGRSVVKGLTTVQNTVERIEGELDFSLRVPAKNKDELGKMATALNRLLERLQASLGEIANSAAKVAQASTRMNETSDQLASSSSAQSTAAANMASSVQQLTVSIAHVGERADDTRQATAEAGSLATAGRGVVDATVLDIRAIADTVQQASERIRELGAQSDRISTVVAVIREVADQTNLLALNAAIEAARAGEQGRGFAVVADEVRKLAERTAKSTQEITAMVDAVRGSAQSAEAGMALAVSRVGAGVKRTDEISQSILQISSGCNNAVEMVNEISSSISEQASASTSIALQVEKIAQMAEDSSTAAARSAESAHELDVLAAEVSKIVSTYKL
jgi:methyl-accepting chemotaxis protein